MNNDLDQQLRLALEGCRGEWPAISARASVSYSWLSKFVNGRIPNPGYETLKKLDAAMEVKRKDAPAIPEKAGV